MICLHTVKWLNSSIGPYLVLTLWAREDQGAMVMKEYSTFLQTPALQEPHQIIESYPGHLLSSAEIHLQPQLTGLEGESDFWWNETKFLFVSVLV